MAGLGQGKTRLAALHPEPAAERRRVLGAAVRRVGVYLGVQVAQFVFVRGRLRPVQQLERQAGRGHVHDHHGTCAVAGKDHDESVPTEGNQWPLPRHREMI